MIGRHLKRLRCLGLYSMVKELPRPSNQTFQFGGGTKTAIRRLKIPFCVRTQLEDVSTHGAAPQAPPVGSQLSRPEMARALASGEDYTVRSDCGKYEDRWSLLVVSGSSDSLRVSDLRSVPRTLCEFFTFYCL